MKLLRFLKSEVSSCRITQYMLQNVCAAPSRQSAQEALHPSVRDSLISNILFNFTAYKYRLKPASAIFCNYRNSLFHIRL